MLTAVINFVEDSHSRPISFLYGKPCTKHFCSFTSDEGELTAEIKAELSTDTEKILSELEYIQSLLYQTISQNQMIPGTFIRKSAEVS